MEVLGLLLVLDAFYFSVVVLVFVLYFISLWCPTLLELCLGAWLWSSGHDNIGMIVIIGGIVVQCVLITQQSKGSFYDPMAGKTKIYNKDGRIIGYRDKN